MAVTDREAEVARKMLDVREQRYERFGHELFDEYAWEMLLALFIADAEGRKLTGKEAVAESQASEPIGRRWLAHLRQTGMVCGDESGDGPVTLSSGTLNEMESFLRAAAKTMEQ